MALLLALTAGRAAGAAPEVIVIDGQSDSGEVIVIGEDEDSLVAGEKETPREPEASAEPAAPAESTDAALERIAVPAQMPATGAACPTCSPMTWQDPGAAHRFLTGNNYVLVDADAFFLLSNRFVYAQKGLGAAGRFAFSGGGAELAELWYPVSGHVRRIRGELMERIADTLDIDSYFTVGGG